MKQSERPSYKKWYALNRERLIAKAIARNRDRGANYRHKVYLRFEAKNQERLRPLRARKALQWYHEAPEYYAAQARLYRTNLRQEFLIAYGGVCRCCGESEAAFLTLEHKRRDGKAHRSKVGGTSSQVLADLKRRGWPKDNYEILCFNCNRASWEQGICPHQVRK